MDVKIEILDTLAALITAASGLVATLAWNGVIQSIFKAVLGSAKRNPPMVTYAVAVTIAAVLATIRVTRAVGNAKGASRK